MFRIASIVVAVVVPIVGPNALWLDRSTARVENLSSVALESLTLTIDSSEVIAGTVGPKRSSRLLLLPDRGDATLSVLFTMDGQIQRACNEYVEGSTYHVEITVAPDLTVVCRASLPIFSRLISVEFAKGIFS